MKSQLKRESKECKKVCIPIVPTLNLPQSGSRPNDLKTEEYGTRRRFVLSDCAHKYATMRPSNSSAKHRGIRTHRQSLPGSTISISNACLREGVDTNPSGQRCHDLYECEGTNIPQELLNSYTNAQPNYHPATITSSFHYSTDDSPIAHQRGAGEPSFHQASEPSSLPFAKPFIHTCRSPVPPPRASSTDNYRGNYAATLPSIATTARPPSCNSAKVKNGEGVDRKEEGEKSSRMAAGGSRPLTSSSSHPIHHLPTPRTYPPAYFTTAIPPPQQQSIVEEKDQSDEMPIATNPHLYPGQHSESPPITSAHHSLKTSPAIAGNRNSTGSTSSSQTSSGYESIKIGSISSPSSHALANSNSSSSCTSTYIRNSPNSEQGSVTITCVPKGEKTAPTVAYSSSSRASVCSNSTISDGKPSTSQQAIAARPREIAHNWIEGLEKEPSTSKSGGRTENPYGSIAGDDGDSYERGKFRKAKSRVDIEGMINKGVPESEIIAEWLQRLCLSQYLTLFIAQGFDLVSISRCTPEDLTTLGISNPEDRKRLVRDIQSWSVDRLEKWPSEVEPSEEIGGWLSSIGLIQYEEVFEEQGYLTMKEMTTVTWEDLEDIGVKKLGHMKRICLALKKLKLVNRKKLPAAISGSPHDHEYSNTLKPHHIRQMLVPLLPSTSTAKPAAAHAAMHAVQQPSEFSNPMEALDQINRRHSQPSMRRPAGQHQKITALPSTHRQLGNGKAATYRPVHPVHPHMQTHQASKNYFAGARIQQDTSGEEHGGRKIFGLVSPQQQRRNDIDEIRTCAPPQLNLYRTSQILSEFSQLPVSLNGEVLRSTNSCNHDAGVLKDPKHRYGHHSPPSPAPIPTVRGVPESSFNNSSVDRQKCPENNYVNCVQLREPAAGRQEGQGSDFNDSTFDGVGGMNHGNGTQAPQSNIAQIDHMLRDLSQELDSILVPAQKCPTEQKVASSAANAKTLSDLSN